MSRRDESQWRQYNNTGRRVDARPLQELFNQLALWAYKNMNKKKKKTHTYKLSFFLTKRLFFFFLLMINHNHGCLQSGPPSFPVECESRWGPTGLAGIFRSPHQQTSVQKTKNKQNDPPSKKKQISDMQTSTLSRNKYTKSWGKASGGLPAFQSGYTDTWFQQYGHTDIVGQGHFIKHLIRNERCYWSRGVGCICFLPRHMKKWSVLKFACQKKKIQQLQSVHSLPENIQNLTKKKKGIEKLYSKTEPTEVLDSNQNMRIKKEKKKRTKKCICGTLSPFLCVSAANLL